MFDPNQTSNSNFADCIEALLGAEEQSAADVMSRLLEIGRLGTGHFEVSPAEDSETLLMAKASFYAPPAAAKEIDGGLVTVEKPFLAKRFSRAEAIDGLIFVSQPKLISKRKKETQVTTYRTLPVGFPQLFDRQVKVIEFSEDGAEVSRWPRRFHLSEQPVETDPEQA